MGGHVLIVDRDPARHAALRGDLGLSEAEVIDLADPAEISSRVAHTRPDLLLLDLDDGGDEGLDGLRRLHARPGLPIPAIALVPPDRPDLRLAALDAGAADATERGIAPRLLQARVRSLLRQRDDTLGDAPAESRELGWSGLAEAPAPFVPVAPLAPPPSMGRVALLSARSVGAVPPAESVARLLGAEVDRLTSARELGTVDGPAYDLVVIDGAGTRGDLLEGARVLALLADLQGRQRGGPASTLVLLPASAVETAALALDLGASDVVAGPVAPSEVALRARAVVARRRLREALRDQVRLGLRAAVTDPLTGLHNRRYAETTLRRMAGSAPGSPARGLALVMVDIDHFKPINDRHGHAAGDRVLVEVARRFRAALRPSDLLARVGGEEFLLALPDATAEEAGLVAERLRRSVCQRPFVLDGEGAWHRDGALAGSQPAWDGLALPNAEARLPMVRVTVSLGVAAVPPKGLDPGPGLAALIRRADAALYAAKSAGRDRVMLAPPAA